MSYEIHIEHPAGPFIQSDWATVIYPKTAWDAKSLGSATSLKFRRADGAEFEAYHVADRGLQGKVLKIATSWADSSVIEGDIVASSAAASLTQLAHYQDGDGISSAETPVITGYTLQSTESLRNSLVEKVDRLVFAEDNLPTANEGRKQIINLFRVKRHLHPVTTWFIQIVNQQSKANRSEVFEQTLTIDFGAGAKARLVDASRFAEVCDYYDEARRATFGVADENEIRIKGLKVHHGVAPSFKLRVHYEQANATIDADEMGESPFTTAMRELAAYDEPVGKYILYGTNLGGARWLTMGVIPGFSTEILTSYLRETLEKLPSMEEHPEVYSRRPHSQAYSTNQAGTQRYGWSATGAVFGMSPYAAYRFLRLSAEDEQLRPVHIYSSAGAHITPTTNPNVITSNRAIHSSSTDKLSLAAATLPSRVSPASRRTADDQQHVDDITLHAFLGLFDDPDLMETQRHIINREAADSRIKNGWINGAARGYGRPVFSLATAYWLTQGTTEGTLAYATLKTWVDNLETNWIGASVLAGPNADGPIRPVRVVGPGRPDPRMPSFRPDTGAQLRTIVPYENASCVAALVAQAIVLADDATRRTKCINIGFDVMQTICECIMDNSSGSLKVPYYVGFLEGADLGNAPPAAWLNERNSTLFDKYVREGGGRWTTWSAAGILLGQWFVDQGKTLTGAAVARRLGAIETLLQDTKDDEFYRWTAVPLTGAMAPLV